MNIFYHKFSQMIFIIITTLFLSFFMRVSFAFAGVIEIKRTSNCDIKFSKEISEGDSLKLIKALESITESSPNYDLNVKWPTTTQFDIRNYVPRLCLNSKGGNFYEAVKFIKRIVRKTPVITIVESGDHCFSACALIFLVGHVRGTDGTFELSRKIHTRAKLGFHAPYISNNEEVDNKLLNRSYRAGVLAVANLLDLSPEFFPRSLMAEFLRSDANEIYLINNVGQLSAWNIGLISYVRPEEITEQGFSNLCFNSLLYSELYDGISSFQGLMHWADNYYDDDGLDIKQVKGGMKKIVKEGGGEDPTCTAFIHTINSEMYIYAEMGDDVDSFGRTNNSLRISSGFANRDPLKEISKISPDAFTPAFKLYPAKMKIYDISFLNKNLSNIPSLWEHNGSQLHLYKFGAIRKFKYNKPRSGLLKVGVKTGDIVFKGYTFKDLFFGTAYNYSKKCGRIGYEVMGSILNNSQRVTLEGRAPKRDKNCKITSFKNEFLIFNIISTE